MSKSELLKSTTATAHHQGNGSISKPVREPANTVEAYAADHPILNITRRPRRNRKSAAVRGLCAETHLFPEHLVYPLFIHESDKNEEISAMPGCQRLSLQGLIEAVGRAHEVGVSAVAIFPKIADNLKTELAEEAYNDAGLVPRAIAAVKKHYPEVAVITDVALDPYSSMGHDGLVDSAGRIVNDATVSVLCRQAICQARAGADIIAPSDMMDGRIGAIRDALDSEGFEDVSILSYAAKYASAFYGPFRGALDSAPRAGDKKSYQMNPANVREALEEVSLDYQEGADMVMIKPAGAYLDVIARVRDFVSIPVAAYQVSGEYLMIKSAAASGWLDERKIVLESLLAIKRAGADIILSYFAPQAARWIREG